MTMSRCSSRPVTWYMVLTRWSVSWAYVITHIDAIRSGRLMRCAPGPLLKRVISERLSWKYSSRSARSTRQTVSATAVLWSTGLCAIYLVSRHYCPSNRPTCYMIDHLRWPISTRATHWSRDPCPTWPVTHDRYIKLFVNITTLSDLTTNNNNECVNIGSLHFLDQSWTETKDWDQTAQLNLVSVRNWD